MSELAVVFYKIIKHHSHCLMCGSPQTQFHHVCPEEKIAEVYKVASKGDLFATIKEIDKCVPLCDPDHRAVHKGRIPGWMNGKHDNGRLSQAFMAAQYMPYTIWFTRHHPHIVKRFYRDYIDREHEAVLPLLNQCGIPFPKTKRLFVLPQQQQCN